MPYVRAPSGRTLPDDTNYQDVPDVQGHGEGEDMKLTKKQKRLILEGMRSRLARPKGWVKGTFIRAVGTDKDGELIHGFCLAGAGRDAYREVIGESCPDEVDLMKTLSIETLAKARLASHPKLSQVDIDAGDAATFHFNDASSTRKKDVLALVDEKLAELS